MAPSIPRTERHSRHIRLFDVGGAAVARRKAILPTRGRPSMTTVAPKRLSTHNFRGMPFLSAGRRTPIGLSVFGVEMGDSRADLENT
jgi:hypothetical protein